MTVSDTTRLAYAYLSRVSHGPNRALWDLLRSGRTAEEIARGIHAGAHWARDVAQPTMRHWVTASPAHDLDAAARVGARLVTPEDDEWPHAAFERFSAPHADGEHLQHHQDTAVAPVALWVRGDANLNEMTRKAVGLVGNRAASLDGAEVAQAFAKGITGEGVPLVVDGSRGIAHLATQAAVERLGRVVSIQAAGPDVGYPSALHREREEVLDCGGLIVTEYAPGVAPVRANFAARNRLLAVFSSAVVLVQSPWRSGALRTISWAEFLQVPTFAVPGPANSTGWQGSDRLISDGRARPASTVRDLVLMQPGAGELAAWTVGDILRG